MIHDIEKRTLDSLEASRLQLETARNIIQANKLHDYRHQVRIAHDHILAGLALLTAECSLIESRLNDPD